jgi:hypothetical protein
MTNTIKAEDMTDADWARVYGVTVEELYAAEEAGEFDQEEWVCPEGYNDAACDAFCDHTFAETESY